jgi:xylan 1,4-beta-xylosidase
MIWSSAEPTCVDTPTRTVAVARNVQFGYDVSMKIRNPVLRGFNPDPSVIRVDEVYYIATSTFEWYPGVQIHCSRDLVRWQLVTRPLVRAAQLDMSGDPNSGGIWAPCLSYSDGLFWLVYTDVKQHTGSFKTTHNYLVTAPAIEGPWSDPVYLNSSGFDPSLFHDDDGRKWLVNMNWEWRPGRNHFAGILLQEYDAKEQTLIGPIRNIFRGTSLGFTEGPHLYRYGGRYYLLTAEGGTGHDHAATMARSNTIEGPYEVDPANPILTSVGNDSPLRKSGHGDLVETPDGWFMVHLCSRPIGQGIRDEAAGWSVLGRETGIQRVEWTHDGWLRLLGDGNVPAVAVDAPSFAESGATESEPGTEQVDEFDSQELSLDWQWLRTPETGELFSLLARPGCLRMYGHEPPSSTFRQALVARRQQAFRCTARTILEFEPADCKHIAGLICYYNTLKYHYLYATSGDGGNRVLGIMTAVGGKESFPLSEAEVVVPSSGPFHLRVDVDYERLQFLWSPDGSTWNEVGPVLDATILSDELWPGGGFTGAFIGLCCQDLSGQNRHADFLRFAYHEEPE